MPDRKVIGGESRSLTDTRPWSSPAGWRGVALPSGRRGQPYGSRRTPQHDPRLARRDPPVCPLHCCVSACPLYCRIKPYWIKAAPLRGAAGPASAPPSGLGGPGRRTPGRSCIGTLDQIGSSIMQTRLAAWQGTSPRSLSGQVRRRGNPAIKVALQQRPSAPRQDLRQDAWP